MENLIGGWSKNYEERLYLIFRVFIGLLFMQHGAQKLLGIFGGVDGNGGTAALFSMYGLAGIIELFGGILIAIGLLTRIIAAIAGIEMIAAQFIAHIPNGFIPIQNGGELGLLFLLSFLILIIHGSARFSVEKALLDKEIF